METEASKVEAFSDVSKVIQYNATENFQRSTVNGATAVPSSQGRHGIIVTTDLGNIANSTFFISSFIKSWNS
jgi:hypothetical protein